MNGRERTDAFPATGRRRMKEGSSMNKKRILVVDDEADLVETLRFSLELEGYDVLTAFNGEEALNQARKEIPDLMLLDLMLPKLDGYKVCRLLKFDEKFKHIPILMLTAKTQERDKQTGMETGANEYITKPFDMDELMKKVKGYLK
jgi:DNA-binding response OmpR family regulator